MTKAATILGSKVSDLAAATVTALVQPFLSEHDSIFLIVRGSHRDSLGCDHLAVVNGQVIAVSLKKAKIPPLAISLKDCDSLLEIKTLGFFYRTFGGAAVDAGFLKSRSEDERIFLEAITECLNSVPDRIEKLQLVESLHVPSVGKRIEISDAESFARRLQTLLTDGENVQLVVEFRAESGIGGDLLALTTSQILVFEKSRTPTISTASIHYDNVNWWKNDRQGLNIRDKNGHIFTLGKLKHEREDLPVVEAILNELVVAVEKVQKAKVPFVKDIEVNIRPAAQKSPVNAQASSGALEVSEVPRADPIVSEVDYSRMAVGKKVNEKDVKKLSAAVAGKLRDGELPLLLVKISYAKPRRSLLLVTNERVLMPDESLGAAGRVDSLDIRTVSRLNFDQRLICFQINGGSIIQAGNISHINEDEPVLRKFMSELIKSNNPGGAVVVGDPSSRLEAGPRTKPKNIRSLVIQVDSELVEGEELLFLETNYPDTYIVTTKRILAVSSREVKTADFSELIRLDVRKEGIHWLVVGADSAHNFSLVAKLSHEDSARWLMGKMLTEFPQFRDPWLREVRMFIGGLALEYAFDAVLPNFWPQRDGESTIMAIGTGEDRMLFSSERTVVLPELKSFNKSDWAQIIWAPGEVNHYTYTGSLIRSRMCILLTAQTRDGRRYEKLQVVGESQQAYNSAIPAITESFRKLVASGYPVIEGDYWRDQTQAPPPAPTQNTTYYSGFSIDY